MLKAAKFAVGLQSQSLFSMAMSVEKALGSQTNFKDIASAFAIPKTPGDITILLVPYSFSDGLGILITGYVWISVNYGRLTT